MEFLTSQHTPSNDVIYVFQSWIQYLFEFNGFYLYQWIMRGVTIYLRSGRFLWIF